MSFGLSLKYAGTDCLPSNLISGSVTSGCIGLSSASDYRNCSATALFSNNYFSTVQNCVNSTSMLFAVKEAAPDLSVSNIPVANVLVLLYRVLH